MGTFFPLSRHGNMLPPLAMATMAALFLPASASAQQRPYGPRAPKMETLAHDLRTGVIAKIGPGMLMLKLPKGGDLWAATPAPNASIEVSGPASRDMLQPKQFVSCSVALDATWKPTEPSTMVVFTEGGVPGVFAAGIDGGMAPGSRPGSPRRAAGSYTVSGTIQKVDGDVISLLTGQNRFEITVAEDADLVLRSQNVALAAEGDEVEVDGKYFQKGQLMVTSLKISLAKAVTPQTLKRRPRP